MSVRAALASVLTCLILAAGLGVDATTAPASASITQLCEGYASCADEGMSNAGYRAANDTMYWRMYSGHNCTNYAAYRMVRAGMANIRPWSGEGNASNWGHANRSRTDDTPAVGAVAWWDAYDGPAGSAGHVAYVEQVLSPDVVIVSQDSWRGDFSWARIVRGGGSWPTGFIHFHDAPLTNTARPAVSGTPKVGATLSSSPGTWSPGDPTIRYQWEANGVDIAGATGPALTLRASMLDARIAVRTTASKLGYPTSVTTSAPTRPVAPGVITNNEPPTVGGEAQVDSTLTATAGLWTPTPGRLTYQWTADGAPVAGGRTAVLTAGPELVGKALAVTVTATKNGYPAVSSTSAVTNPVLPGTFTVRTPPTLAIDGLDGAPRPGQVVTFDRGRFAPSEADVSLQWLRAGVPVEGAVGPTYRLTRADLGARISARMTVTRPGYTPLRTRTAPTWRVKATPHLHLVKTPGRERLRLEVTAGAPGGTPVLGTLQLRLGHKLLGEYPLGRNPRVIRLTDLPTGLQTFTLRYTGSDTVRAATRTFQARIG
ncbi:MAG TPA: CHAP domain-containing protein [Nocardioides sp.]|nr:CHAP domain-containing protein [Nocardioides sp.]